MTHQWTAEEVLEAPLALELIREQFPGLGLSKIRLLGAGWDNTAFIVDEDLIFRFPRREISVSLLETEWSLLPKLALRLPLPIPNPKWRGSPTSRFPWPFIGYQMLTGCTACYANLSEEERGRLAEPIANFLVNLHATPPSIVSECQIAGDNHSRIDWKILIPTIIKNIEDLSLLNLLENRTKLELLIESLYDLRPPMNSVVVHGDFYVRHILINESHNLVGVIDWGDIHVGDPAIDLAIAHSFLPKIAHANFRKAYGVISEETWSLALLRAIHSSILLILYGHHSKDPVILREGLRTLKIITD